MSISAVATNLFLGVCLQLASTAETAPSSMPVFVPVQEFTLAWVHSIEKVRWEEDYHVILSQQSNDGLKADFGGAVDAGVSGSMVVETNEPIGIAEFVDSIEHKRSEQPVLLATAARIRGSAAGMEPPEGAVFKDGWYHYTPLIGEHREIRLTRSEFVADYEWCDQQGCRSLADILPSDGGVTLMWACEAVSN
ncbi:MAG: DUF1850 domain-containing protein [Alcaligenaceae bacterium]|nr:DUF1850 domain-containing protein [Alcaligenaceae bacterium]